MVLTLFVLISLTAPALPPSGRTGPPDSRPAQQDGVPAPWESKAALTNAQQQLRSVSSALNTLDTTHWKGDYAPLLTATRQRVDAVADAVKRMADKPESLSLGLEAFLSMEHVSENIESLARGADRFQPAVSKDLEEASNSFQQVKEDFQSYLLGLSRYLEKNVASSAKDLESCHEQLFRRTPSTSKKPNN
jgi:methyl-accepting chemotaxis protein